MDFEKKFGGGQQKVKSARTAFMVVERGSQRREMTGIVIFPRKRGMYFPPDQSQRAAYSQQRN